MKKTLNIAALFLLAACGESAVHTAEQPVRTQASSAVAEQAEKKAEQPKETVTDKREKLLAQFAAQTAEIEARLKKASPQEADRLYEQFESAPREGSILSQLNDVEGEWLNNFYSAPHWKETESGGWRPTALLRKKKQQAAAVGLEYVYLSEGEGVLRLKSDFMLNLFGCCVSPDYHAYLDTLAETQKSVVATDAAVHVSWPELGDKVALWESFLSEYPNSRLKEQAESYYQGYLELFLLGADNTPTYIEDHVYPAYDAAWQYFIASNPESPVSAFLKTIRGKPRDEAVEIIKQYWIKRFGRPLIH
ncbi:Uncharacterised protein [Neisseria zoodegmatis]|uniref:Lipoprotein n=2 Tax=Neisseria zoodegmatis TaxID=326523 RepID=A0A378WU80_9NEIS|nr:Uncharacterised protein [Neisseria zoodegmatis]